MHVYLVYNYFTHFYQFLCVLLKITLINEIVCNENESRPKLA